MSEKQQLLETFEQEFARTERVIGAYPSAGAEYRPHERSASARELVWTLASGYRALTDFVLSEADAFAPAPQPPPASWTAVVDGLASAHSRFVRELGDMPDDRLRAPIRAPVGPNEAVDVPRAKLLWLILMDQVHHRGQLSVYLRLAGGRVPSIYGPSADEPW